MVVVYSRTQLCASTVVLVEEVSTAFTLPAVVRLSLPTVGRMSQLPMSRCDGVNPRAAPLCRHRSTVATRYNFVALKPSSIASTTLLRFISDNVSSSQRKIVSVRRLKHKIVLHPEVSSTEPS